MSESKMITGQVVDILNKFSVVIDRGANDKVKKGMRFVIYAEGDQLFDDKGVSLGTLEIPKAEVEVVHVMDKMSIAEHFETHTVPTIPGFGSTYTVRNPLPVAEQEIKAPKVDLGVHKGDKVRQVLWD